MNVKNVENNSVGWDYNEDNNLSSYGDSFLYDYLQNYSAEFKNSIGQSFLDYNSSFVFDKEHYTLLSYMQKAYQNDNKNRLNFASWITRFIRNNIIVADNPQKEIKLPTIDGEAKRAIIAIGKVVSSGWLGYLKNNFGDLNKIINYDLSVNFNSKFNKKLIFNHTDMINYSVKVFGDKNINIQIEPTDIMQSDNVVTNNLEESKIKNMHNDEVIINSSFAKKFNIKIGDKISTGSLRNIDGTPSLVPTQYKVIGVGIKLTDLYDTDSSSVKVKSSNDKLILYCNDYNIENYSNYIYLNNNSAMIDNSVIPNFFKLQNMNRLIVNSSDIDAYMSFLYNANVSTNFKVTKYSDSIYLTNIKMLEFQILIIIFIIIILFILSIVFIHFYIKSKIISLRHQIGILKAFGYRSANLAMIFTIQIFATFCLSAILGYLISIPFQKIIGNYFTQDLLISINDYNSTWWLLLVVFLLIPIIISLICYCSIYLMIRVRPLALLSDFKNKNVIKTRNMSFLYLPFKIRLHVSLAKMMWKNHLIVFVIFIILDLLLMFQTATPLFMSQVLQQLLFYTAKDVDHRYNDGENYTWNYKQGKIDFNEITKYDLLTKKYENFDSIMNLSDNNVTKIINSYLSVDRTHDDASERMQIENILMKLGIENLNHSVIEEKKLMAFLNMYNYDYKKFLHSEGQPVYELIYKQINNFWLPKFQLIDNSVNQKMHPLLITFNNLFLKKGEETATLNISLDSILGNNFYKSQYNLIGLNGDSLPFFKWNQISDKNWEDFFNENGNERIVPVIVSKKFADLNKQKINDSFDMNFSIGFGTIKLRIVGINSADNVSDNIYCSYQLLNRYYFTEQMVNKQPFNQVFSKQRIINKAFLENKTSGINLDYLSFSFWKNGNQFNFVDLSNSTNELKSFINMPYADHNFESYFTESYLANQKVSNVESIFTTLQYFQFIIVLILVISIVASTLEKIRRFILTLKAFGYKNYEIILISLVGYLFYILLAYALSALLVWRTTLILEQTISNVLKSTVMFYLANIIYWIPVIFIVIICIFTILYFYLLMCKTKFSELSVD